MMTALLLLASLFPPPEPLPDVCEADFDVLPNEQTVNDSLKFADAYAAFLEDRRVTHGDGWGLRELIDEARECRKNWRLLQIAQRSDNQWLTEPGPTEALRLLRDRIGARAYYRGCLPPAVPVWRRRYEN